MYSRAHAETSDVTIATTSIRISYSWGHVTILTNLSTNRTAYGLRMMLDAEVGTVGLLGRTF